MELKIPRQAEPTQDSFPGTPRKVKKWLSELQSNDIGSTTRELYSGLRHSNRLHNDARARVEVMELFRPAARSVLENLHKRYSMMGLPLPEKSRRIFDLNLAVLTEMAFGYKIAIKDYHVGNSALPPKIHGMAAHRAITYLSEIILRCAQIYVPVPAAVWSDLHQVYASCEGINFHTKPIADHELKKEPRTTVENAYKRALLLWLSRPESMRRGEVAHVYNALESWSSQADLGAFGSRQDVNRLFGINLKTDAPPSSLRFLHAEEGEHIRTLDLGSLLRTVSRELDHTPEMESPLVQANEMPRNALVCLQNNWGLQAERRSARATRNERVTVEIGLKDIHAHMVYVQSPPAAAKPKPASIYDDDLYTDLRLMTVPQEERNAERKGPGFITHPDMHDREDINVWDTVVSKSGLTEAAMDAKRERIVSPPTKTASDSSSIQEWSIVNISSGGFGLKWSGETTSRAHVGELIALQEATVDKKSMMWRIGVMRWMQFAEDNSFVCGVQTISPRIVPVMVERKRSNAKVDTTLQECLMLPEIKPIGQAASLVAPAHMFRLGELVTIKVGGRELKYKLTGIEEQTGSFSQFLIQPTSVGVAPKVPEQKEEPDAKDATMDRFNNLWDAL